MFSQSFQSCTYFKTVWTKKQQTEDRKNRK